MQELSPTTDSNLVVALMSLIDCQLDEFQDEAKIAQLEEREIITWLEVSRKALWRSVTVDRERNHGVVYKVKKKGEEFICSGQLIFALIF